MEFKFAFTEQEVNIIGIALADQPYKVSHNVINKLQEQVNIQLEANKNQTGIGNTP
jgi:hypothetical protein